MDFCGYEYLHIHALSHTAPHRYERRGRGNCYCPGKVISKIHDLIATYTSISVFKIIIYSTSTMYEELTGQYRYYFGAG